MKVQELIDLLRTQDPEALVAIASEIIGEATLADEICDGYFLQEIDSFAPGNGIVLENADEEEDIRESSISQYGPLQRVVLIFPQGI